MRWLRPLGKRCENVGMPLIKGARAELRRLKREIADLDAKGFPSTVEEAAQRTLLQRQMCRLELAIAGYDSLAVKGQPVT